MAFAAALEKDALIGEVVNNRVKEVLEACKSHISSCMETFEVLVNDPLLSESTAKAVIALVIHRPFLYGVQKSQIADIESLLLIK
jgi:hypothetical protein